MKHTFKKIRLGHNSMGLPNVHEENDDVIKIDFSNHTVEETIKGKKQINIWPYLEIVKNHLTGIYTLSVPNGKTMRNGKEVTVKGYFNDWNFKPNTLKEKSIVLFYTKKDSIMKFVKGIISLVN